MRLRDAEDQFIEPLQSIPFHQYLAISLACFTELREIYRGITDNETADLLDQSLQLIRATYLSDRRHLEIEQLFERWIVRNRKDDGSPGYLNLRFVFEDLIGELAGERPPRSWLDRVGYPIIFAPGSELLTQPVLQIGNLVIDDESRPGRLFPSFIELSARIRSRSELVELNDLEQIRREVFTES